MYQNDSFKVFKKDMGSKFNQTKMDFRGCAKFCKKFPVV